jgi:hypothetical protein
MQLTDASAIARMVSPETTAPFHHLASAIGIAMGMPLWTKIVQMAACATVPMDFLAAAARPHRHATLPLIAAVMEKLLIWTRLTVALAFAQMASVAVIAPHRHLALPACIVLGTEKRATKMQPMDAIATVRMVSVGTIVPFHQLAAARSIAMDMPLWTKIVQMAACATVPMDGLATVARSLHLVMPNIIALVMEQPPTLIEPTDAIATVRMASVGLTVPFRQLATASIIATGIPLSTKTAQMAVCATVPMDSLATVATSLQLAMLQSIAVGTD